MENPWNKLIQIRDICSKKLGCGVKTVNEQVFYTNTYRMCELYLGQINTASGLRIYREVWNWIEGLPIYIK